MQEFQTGAHDKNDLGSFLGRVDIVLGSVKNAANLAVLKTQRLDRRRNHRVPNRPRRFWPRRTIPRQIQQRREGHHHAKERRRRHALRKHSDHPKRRRFGMAGQRPRQRRRARRISAGHLPARPRRQPRADTNTDARDTEAINQYKGLLYERKIDKGDRKYCPPSAAWLHLR